MIDGNLAQENFDEEFYHILANACLGNPELLLEILTESVNADMENLEATVACASSSLIVRGQWHITVELTEDRSQLGTITLYDAGGVELLSDICLGKSESGDSVYVYYGNTPTGEYTGYLYTHNYSTYSYGPYQVIRMTGQSGAIAESGRSGIWIHGGDPSTNTSSSYYPLRVTNGCVRVTNDTQLQLQTIITDLVTNHYHYTEGTISITESATGG